MGDEPAGQQLTATAPGADTPTVSEGGEEREGADHAAWPCTWCGEAGPEVVPLIAGRGRRRRVVAAICPRCVNPAPASGATMLLLVGFGALALASLWVWSAPGRPSRWATTAIAVSWAVAVVAYGVQAARAAWAARQGTSSALRSWRWALPPLLGALVAVAVLGALPLRARFALSRAAIASAAEDASPGVGRHGRLVAFPSGLVQQADGSTGVLVDARCGFFRADPAGDAPNAGAAGEDSAASEGSTAGEGGSGGLAPRLEHAVRLGGGWQAGCLTMGVVPAAPTVELPGRTR